MKHLRNAVLCLLLLAFAIPCNALAAPMLTAEFLNNAELLNSAQGDDGSYTQMYRIDDVSISCGREETFYTLDEAMESKLADWYSEVDEPDVLEECEIDGIAAKHARLSLSRGETPKQVDFYCLRDGDWLVYVEFTYPVEQAEEIATQLEGWLDALSVVEGNVNAGDLQWEEVAVYLEVAGEEVFPTLGDLAAWAQPQTYACKHAENLLAVTLNITGGSISVLVDDAENILSEDVAEMDALPEEIQALPFTLLSLVWTSDEFLFNPPRNFYPGNAMQDLLVSFPDAMIQMVSNSQYGFNQCIELSATNPEKTEERIDLTFYGVDTTIGQVVLEVIQ